MSVGNDGIVKMVSLFLCFCLVCLVRVRANEVSDLPTL